MIFIEELGTFFFFHNTMIPGSQGHAFSCKHETHNLLTLVSYYILSEIMKEGTVLLSQREFIQVSIEINLFFQRIMKEHLFFIETNLQPVEADNIAKAKMLKQQFEQLLADTVYYANGVVSEKAIQSDEIVTPFTLRAEELNAMLTGAKINTQITKDECKLSSRSNGNYQAWLGNVVTNMNNRSYSLLRETIVFQKKLLALSLECKIFISLYDEMLEHDTREAEYYLQILSALQNRVLPRRTLCGELNFWNNIMGEHAQFIDGMLDPTEKALKKTAETSAKSFAKLVEECIRTAENQIFRRSFDCTEEIRKFKISSAEGLLKCRIRSVIPPLLADHVLREANHYLRLLMMMKK